MQSRKSEINAFIQEQMESQHIPGLSVAVAREGDTIAAQGYGFANLELDVPATVDTVYQIGSLTKQFTATAIMLLVEERKVDLDASISLYQGGLPDTWSGVTVRHLLNHTSGITSFTNHADFARMQHSPTSRAEVIELLADAPLEFPPGERYAYCNTGYYLLGHIIEAVSGQTYADFLQTRIFQVLGMSSTQAGDWEQIIPHRADGYRWVEGRWCNAEYFSLSWAFSAGSIISSVLDLVRWNAAQTQSLLLPRSSWEKMWIPAVLSDGTETEYGFGWIVSQYRGLRVLGHGGAAPGFSAFAERLREDGLVVVVLTNVVPSGAAQIVRGIAEFYHPALSTS